MNLGFHETDFQPFPTGRRHAFQQTDGGAGLVLPALDPRNGALLGPDLRGQGLPGESGAFPDPPLHMVGQIPATH